MNLNNTINERENTIHRFNSRLNCAEVKTEKLKTNLLILSSQGRKKEIGMNKKDFWFKMAT